MAQLDPSRYKRLTVSMTYAQSDGIYWDSTNERLVVAVGGTVYEAPLQVASQARGDVLRRGASAWERLAAKTAGSVVAGDGTDANSLSPSGAFTVDGSGVTTMAGNLIRCTTGTISAADIVAVGAGKFGHAQGYPLLAEVGAHNAPEFVSCALVYDYDTAQYGAGGDITVNLSGGGAAQSDPVTAANSVGAASDKLVVLRPPTATAGVVLVENAGLNLVAAAAFTQPGTAAGVIRYALMYRVHATGLV